MLHIPQCPIISLVIFLCISCFTEMCIVPYPALDVRLTRCGHVGAASKDKAAQLKAADQLLKNMHLKNASKGGTCVTATRVGTSTSIVVL